MSGEIINVIDVDFEEKVLKVDGLVLVDYWVFWCGFCKMVVLILEDLFGDYVGKFIIVKLNIDENLDMFKKYGVCGIFMLIVFKNGDVEVIKVGVLLKFQFIVFLDSMF